MVCDEAFLKAEYNKKYSNIDTKIEHFVNLSDTCSGTGVYEYLVANLYQFNEDYDKAEKVLLNALAIEGDYQEKNQYALLDLYIVSGKLDDLQGYSESLIAKQPKWYGGYFGIGYYHLVNNNFSLAHQHLHKANELNVDSDILAFDAVALFKLDEPIAAIKAMQEAVKIDQNVLARNRLAVIGTAYSLIQLNYFSEAEDLLNKASTLEPSYLKDKEFQAAAAACKKEKF